MPMPTVGAEAVATVAALPEVEQVVDEVGCYLHQAGKEQTQHRFLRLELPVGKGQCTAQYHGNEGSRQRLGAGGEEPGLGEVGTHRGCYFFLLEERATDMD